MSVLLYRSETWQTTKIANSKLQYFVNMCGVPSTSGGRTKSQMTDCVKNQSDQLQTRDLQKEVGLDWPHSVQTNNKHKTSATVKSPGEKEDCTPKTDQA